ncbi:hypothetical protein Tco_1111162 [Tanacetum coccineum]|uniref:Uncharacterized protein n=1 Tax=Tanacetum coccineum TaxID=301880 RepID=A0ABQ5ING2_9ASTR
MMRHLVTVVVKHRLTIRTVLRLAVSLVTSPFISLMLKNCFSSGHALSEICLYVIYLPESVFQHSKMTPIYFVSSSRIDIALFADFYVILRSVTWFSLIYGLQLHVSSTTQLNAYTDADWAGCLLPVAEAGISMVWTKVTPPEMLCFFEISFSTPASWVMDLIVRSFCHSMVLIMEFRGLIGLPLGTSYDT